MKTKKMIKKSVKVQEKTSKKMSFPIRDYSRTAVLLDGLKTKKIPLNREINLSTLKINGKLFQDVISSRPLIGTTTRAALKAQGYKVEAVKVHPDNKKLYSVIKITK